MPESPDPTERLAMFLAASPFFIDLESRQSTEGITERIDSLPQNIQNVLTAETTAAAIWNLIIVKHALSTDQVKETARVVRDILIGRESAASIRALVRERVGVEPPIADDIVRVLTAQVISPNYFQISQLYERNQRKQGVTAAGGGARPTSSGPRDDRRAPEREQEPPEIPPGEDPRPPVSPSRPKNVVDLRGGAPLGGDPRRGGLPPSPPPAPDPGS